MVFGGYCLLVNVVKGALSWGKNVLNRHSKYLKHLMSSARNRAYLEKTLTFLQQADKALVQADIDWKKMKTATF